MVVTNTNGDVKIPSPSPPPLGIQVIPFAIKLPSSTSSNLLHLQNVDDTSKELSSLTFPRDDNNDDDHDSIIMMAVVGTIILMGNRSAMIHVGWGHAYSGLPQPQQQQLLSSSETSTTTTPTVATATSLGTGAPTMGPLVLAMPRTSYQGGFGTAITKGTKEPACSSLIGGSDDDHLLAHQMASRLSLRSGRAIFVSCQLSSPSSLATLSSLGLPIHNNMISDDDVNFSSLDATTMISQRAAALAEKEIWNILQQQQQK
jgi:Proteasome assembly chaperone 4